MLAAVTIDEVTVAMVPVVGEFTNVFLDDLSRLPLTRKLSSGSIFYQVLP